MSTILQDVRYAFRGLAKRPAFAVLAIAVVALGIGATTAMFSVLDTLLIRALPYDGAERIVTIREANAEKGTQLSDVRSDP